MALPSLVLPKHKTKLPSNGKTIEYRPFLVKEERILLMAMESKDPEEIKIAVLQIIENCTFDKLKVNDLPIIDIEWIFLQLRIKSKGNTAEYSFKCSACGVQNDKEADLTEVKIVNKDVDDVIKLTSDIGIKLKVPTYDVSSVISKDMNTDDVFNVIIECIEMIYDGEEVHKASNYSKEEVLEFVESLTDAQFKLIQNYFEHLPSLEMEIDFNCAGCKKENKLKLKGLQSFLG